PLRKFRPDAPPALESLINRLLAKDPEERPQSAGQILTLFESAFSGALRVENNQYQVPDSEDGVAAQPSEDAHADDLAGKLPAYSDLDVALEPLWKRAPVRRAALGVLIVFAAVFSWLLWPVLKSTLWSSESIDSVAVLPFKNASGDQNSEYLGAGITDG